MTKSIGIKIEGSRKAYTRCYSTNSARHELSQMVDGLKEGQTIEVKTGNQHHYIEFENKDSQMEFDRVMYYINQYFN